MVKKLVLEPRFALSSALFLRVSSPSRRNYPVSAIKSHMDPTLPKQPLSPRGEADQADAVQYQGQA